MIATLAECDGTFVLELWSYDFAPLATNEKKRREAVQRLLIRAHSMREIAGARREPFGCEDGRIVNRKWQIVNSRKSKQQTANSRAGRAGESSTRSVGMSLARPFKAGKERDMCRRGCGLVRNPSLKRLG